VGRKKERGEEGRKGGSQKNVLDDYFLDLIPIISFILL